jgi:hypothetical protein
MKRKEQDYFEIVEKIIDALQLTEDEELSNALYELFSHLDLEMENYFEKWYEHRHELIMVWTIEEFLNKLLVLEEKEKILSYSIHIIIARRILHTSSILFLFDLDGYPLLLRAALEYGIIGAFFNYLALNKYHSDIYRRWNSLPPSIRKLAELRERIPATNERECLLSLLFLPNFSQVFRKKLHFKAIIKILYEWGAFKPINKSCDMLTKTWETLSSIVHGKDLRSILPPRVISQIFIQSYKEVIDILVVTFLNILEESSDKKSQFNKQIKKLFKFAIKADLKNTIEWFKLKK